MIREEQYLRVLMDHLAEGVYVVDQDRRILSWNHGAEALTGYTEDEMKGARCWEAGLRHVDEDGKRLCEHRCSLAKAMDVGTGLTDDIYVLHKAGYRVPVSIQTVPVRDEQNQVVGAVEIFEDRSAVRALREKMEELEHLSLVDSLTGLANRRCLEAQFKARQDKLERYKGSLGVIFLDLDRFKIVNDSHGHNIGDEVLKMVAQTLMHSSRSFDVPGRWGGEEFLLFAEHLDEKGLREMAERYRTLIATSSLPLESGRIRVTVSVGATLVRAGEDLKSMIDRVDALMYQSKEKGRNCVHVG